MSSHESILRSHKRRTVANSGAYLIPHLRPGLKLLDVGCGPGIITVDFANYVAGSAITGLDPAILAHARTHAGAAALSTANVELAAGLITI
ncbi:S-adenosyl-L-methionine-dependent methyltransferase [Phanerochaete sordida]|uniref:S-adenosyl-L-methionine-dependent methyltransferase n=1 Tax=Phanerochaete sordida TaxID=48140 RepID=A0A9P3GLX5_9APHY|nr:S-adenosyl-L-methionine-dependent methyltransferase [Phanerochaete sordida]